LQQKRPRLQSCKNIFIKNLKNLEKLGAPPEKKALEGAEIKSHLKMSYYQCRC